MRGVRDRLLARTEADRLSAGAGGHPITWRGRAPRHRELAGPVVAGKRVGTHLTRARESARVGPGAGPSMKGATVGRRCGSRIVVASRGHRPGPVPVPVGIGSRRKTRPPRAAPRAVLERLRARAIREHRQAPDRPRIKDSRDEPQPTTAPFTLLRRPLKKPLGASAHSAASQSS